MRARGYGASDGGRRATGASCHGGIRGWTTLAFVRKRPGFPCGCRRAQDSSLAGGAAWLGVFASELTASLGSPRKDGPAPGRGSEPDSSPPCRWTCLSVPAVRCLTRSSVLTRMARAGRRPDGLAPSGSSRRPGLWPRARLDIDQCSTFVPSCQARSAERVRPGPSSRRKAGSLSSRTASMER